MFKISLYLDIPNSFSICFPNIKAKLSFLINFHKLLKIITLLINFIFQFAFQIPKFCLKHLFTSIFTKYFQFPFQTFPILNISVKFSSKTPFYKSKSDLLEEPSLEVWVNRTLNRICRKKTEKNWWYSNNILYFIYIYS